MGDGYVDGSLWFYAPNKGAAILFFILYLLLTLIHIWQCYRYKYFKITGIFFICGFLFATGYALRIYGAFGNYDALVPFIVSVCLIAASPPLVELANYHILGRILAYVPHLSPINPERVLSAFGLVSVIVELLNGLGASFTANPKGNNLEAGKALMKASLALQFIVIACFLCLSSYFHWKCAKVGLRSARKVIHPLVALYASAVIILLRTVYRAVEYFSADGVDWHKMKDLSRVSPIIRHEWYFLVFEATLMLANLGLWNILHPHRYLPADPLVHLGEDGTTEVKGSGWQDSRPFILALFDPMDIVRFCKKDKILQNKPLGGRTGKAQSYEMV